MNLYHLRYFVTLANLEHYTKAAKALMITQPSLSHAIASLEEELGIKLFEKDGRNVVLTRFGHIFKEDVKKSLDLLDTSVKSLQMASSGSGIIELGFLRTLGTKMVPSIVRNYLEAFPDRGIDFHFTTGVTDELLQGLINKQIDIAICSKDAHYEEAITFIPIATQELILIVPKDHPLAEKDAVDLSETLPYPQIIFSKSSGLRQIIDELFNRIGAVPNICYEIQEDQVIAGLVSQNFGIAVVPNMPILKFMDVKKLEITAPSWERNFYLAFMKYRYMPPVVANFRNFVAEKL